MPRWPALVRRARRPSPLLADVALALVLAALSLVTIETERTQSGADVRHAETDLRVTPSPGRLRPGDPVEIRVSKDGKPVSFSKVEPLLTIQNTSSGKWATYEAKPTREPGVYRVPAVFPGKGFYSYTVLYGPFEQNVKIGKPTRPRPAVAVEQTGSDSFPTWPVGLTLLATLPIALRRRFPLSVLAVTLPAALAMDVLYNSVAAYVFFGGAWLLGDRLGARRAYLRELEERAVRLQQERQENERRAAAAEQARIARELHDIIAHNVSVMTVQAAAAGDVFETQPNRAREALASIESTGREALTELRRLLGTVRLHDGASTFDPQPRLARLDALLEQVRGAGLGVELTVEGEPRHLPAGVDLSAYRIVQEALTNTLKHAQASHVSVLVRYGTGAVELAVVDDGAGPATGGGERGNGIIGMRERAALFGGKLEAG